MLPLLVLLGTIAGAWYLLIVRPQNEQQSRHGAVLSELKTGDHVLTVGGIYGRVEAVEGDTVVLELAPGLTSRIASDGIARIVQGPSLTEAAPAVALSTDPQTILTSPHTPAPQVATMQQPQPHQPYQPYPEQPQPLVAHDPSGGMTMRAHVLATQPWGDVRQVVPTQAVQPQYAAPTLQMPVAQTHMPQPVAQHVAPPVAPRNDFLPPRPVIMPFGRPVAQSAQQYAPALAQAQPAVPAATQPQYAPVLATAPSQYVPAVAPLQYVPAVAPMQQAVAPADQNETRGATRRYSAAPEGMGSNLRLDDPSIRDTMERARSERNELAVEYRQLTAPLVDTSPALAHGVPQAVHQPHYGQSPHAGKPQMFAHHPGVAYDPSGATQIPRPHIQVDTASVDPALTSAFQRPTPMTAAHGESTAQPALA